MNMVEDILRYIRQSRISHEAIEFTFSNINIGSGLLTTDKLIENIIIRDTVASDCKMINGMIHKIYLQRAWITVPYNPGNMHSHGDVLTIPPEERMNQDIMGIVEFGYDTGYGIMGNVNNIQSSLSDITMGSTNDTSISSTVVRLNNNQIVVTPLMSSNNMYIKVTLGLDDQFTNLHSDAFFKIRELCVAALQMFIYNRCKHIIERGSIYHGVEINSLADEISSFSDAHERYNELLISYKRSDSLNSNASTNQLVKDVLGGLLG